MQKQELSKTYFLAIQATYQGIDVALCLDGNVQQVITLSKFDASRLLIVTIDSLLKAQAITPQSLAYIAVNQGPGPFTTLRTLLATVNGIAFALPIPLLGIDGLAALASEFCTDGLLVGMLNAFNKDVYYVIGQNEMVHEFGCKQAQELMTQLATQFSNQYLTVVGNAVPLYAADLDDLFGSRVFIKDPNPDTASIGHIASISYRQWKAGDRGTHQLMPLYLKQYSAVMHP